MAIEVFNRYENKYLIGPGVYEKLQGRLLEHMKPDAYNLLHETYSICNLYYDTDDSYLIRTSMSRPRYKEKLRLRAYGTPETDSKVYVEIKKKFRGLVNKRRSVMRLDEAYGFLDSGEPPEIAPYMNRQVMREIAYILEQRRLAPRVYLAYRRRAFFGTEEPDLRVSFDTGIVARRADLRLESGIYGENLLPGGKWLMEIKVARSIPVWLVKLLSEYQIYSSGFSKYGTEYRKTLAENTGGKGAA